MVQLVNSQFLKKIKIKLAQSILVQVLKRNAIEARVNKVRCLVPRSSRNQPSISKSDAAYFSIRNRRYLAEKEDECA